MLACSADTSSGLNLLVLCEVVLFSTSVQNGG